jgi:hypothetical protein
MSTVVNDFSNRVLAKGIKLFAAEASDTVFRYCFGLKGVNGVNMERSGEVDATEMWQGPIGLADNLEEQFFWTQQYAGTKKIAPIELNLNKVPRMYAASGSGASTVSSAGQITYITLLDWFTQDKICQYSLRTRTGFEYTWLGQVHHLPMSGEEGNLWSGVMQVLPVSWICYRPVPASYAPWGSTSPIYGPPGVSSVQLTWSATLPGAVRNNNPSITVGGGGDTAGVPTQ